MNIDPTYRHVTHTVPALIAIRALHLLATAALGAAVTVKALTDLGLGGFVDWAVNGQWDVWIETVYLAAGIASVPFVVFGWVLVACHVTGRKP